MRVFKRLASLFTRIDASDLWRQFEARYGLKRTQVPRLADLRAHNDWPLFMAALDNECNILGEAMLAARGDEAVNLTRGQVLGLRRALTLVDEIIAKEEEIARTLADRASIDARRADATTTALYASPYWRPSDAANGAKSRS